MFSPISVLPPVIESVGEIPDMAFASVNSFIALAVVVKIISSLPFASAMKPPLAMRGVVSVGDVPNTSAPLPVSSVTAAARFAELGVVRKVAMPVPKSELRTSVTAVPVPFLNDGTPLPSEYQAERPAISVGAVPFLVTKCPAAPVPGTLAK